MGDHLHRSVRPALTCLTFMMALSSVSSLDKGSRRRNSARFVTHVSPIFCKTSQLDSGVFSSLTAQGQLRMNNAFQR